MEKIDLLEKLVEVQEMHIELMNDYNNLKCYKDLDHTKNIRIQQLNEEIEQQKEEYASLIEFNEGLTQKIQDLKNQIEDLQKLIPIELVEGQEENQ